MALVTIQRTPSPSVEQDLDATDSSDDVTDGRSQMRKSLSQSYFTVKGAALILPHNEFTKKSARKNHGGEIQQHLQAMLHLLRPEDTIKIAVRLEDVNQYQRYMALVSTKGRQDSEEAVILGIDCSGSQASIGLVLPVWMGLRITLGGDGGFSLHTDEQCYLFKPVSVQTMWSAIQSLVKVQHVADDMKYIRDGLSHTWVGYYKSRVDRKDSTRISQWNAEGVEVFAPSSLSVKSNDDESIKQMISLTLKDVMTTVDLDEATSMMLRKAVEEKMNMSLAEFKGYFDEEVMRILGQMDEPSEILDFLYLGSEWNASNLEELLEKGIDNILNVTKEIDNFFEGRFHYYNVRVTDEDSSDLLKHWDKTYKFISKARSQGSKVLVHCKMGVSRSASTVMAFMMKERRWSVDEAFTFVKERRSCVHPNAGFMEQLHMYQGILTASNKRDIFRSKSDQNLLDESAKDDLELPDMSFLGGDLFHMMSHSDWLSASESVAHGEEWICSLHQDELHDTDMLQVGTEMDTESRSADSMEEVLPDLPSPPPETAGHQCLSLSMPSARPSCERSSGDTEVAELSETGLGIQSDQSCCSADCQQTSVGSPTSRIKPDSSWIRLDIVDTEEESNSILNSKFMFIESVPCCDAHSSNDLNVGTLDSSTIDSHIPPSTDPEGAAVSESHMAARHPLGAANTDPHVANTEHHVANTEHHVANTEPHVSATEPYVSATEPHVLATEPYVSATEPHVSATEPYVSATEPHVAATEPHVTAMQLQRMETDLNGIGTQPQCTTTDVLGAGMDLHRATMDTHGSGMDLQRATTDLHRATTDLHRATTDTHRATMDTHGSGMDLQRATTDLHRATTDLHRATTDTHRATMDTHRALVSQSELLVLSVNSDEVSQVSPSSATTVSEPAADPGSPRSPTDETNTHVHVCIGQTSLPTAPTVPSGCFDSGAIHAQKCPEESGSSLQFVLKTTAHLPSTDKHWGSVPSGSPFVAVTPKSVQPQPSHPHNDLIKGTECCDEVLEVAEELSELEAADPGGPSDTCTSPHSRSDLGAWQCFFPENIPRKPGQVNEMQDDINKTGQVSEDQEADESTVVGLCQETPATLFDVSSESQLLGQVSAHQHVTALSHSHSCVELCTQDDNLAPGSLYERENIPLTPGIVLREKQEIERRQRGEGDQELFDSSQPLLRTSSLKHQRGFPHSKYTHNRRSSGPVLSLREGQKDGHDQSVRFGETLQTDMKKLEACQPGQMREQIMPDTSVTEVEDNVQTEVTPHQMPFTRQLHPPCALVPPPSGGSRTSFQSSETHSSGDTAYSQHHPVDTDTDNQPRARGNIDSETLALIREIGSALLMSPTAQQSAEEAVDTRPCSNMVRYFVRQIEQQTKMASPLRKTVVSCRRAGSSELGECRKTAVTGGEASPGALSPITSPTRSGQLRDLLPATSTSTSVTPATAPSTATVPSTATAPSTAGPLGHSNTQSRATRGFPDTPTLVQNTDDSGMIHPVRICWDVAATSHGLVDAPSLMPESKRHVVPQVLPLSEAEPAISPRSELVVSPSSHSHSFQHDPAEPYVVRHLVERFEPKSPEHDSSESAPDHSLRFNYSHGSLSTHCPGTGQTEDSSVPPRSLEDCSHHSSLSGPQLSSSDHNLSSHPASPLCVPGTTSQPASSSCVLGTTSASSTC